MGQRHRARERAMQCLYEWQMTRAPLDSLLSGFWKAHDESASVKDFCGRLVRGTVADVERIDELIAAQAENWRIDRMGNVDRSILRLGVFELLHEDDTPAAVAIDEAIELAKRFSGDQAGQFVNGVLDGIRRRIAANGAPAEADHGVRR